MLPLNQQAVATRSGIEPLTIRSTGGRSSTELAGQGTPAGPFGPAGQSDSASTPSRSGRTCLSKPM